MALVRKLKLTAKKIDNVQTIAFQLVIYLPDWYQEDDRRPVLCGVEVLLQWILRHEQINPRTLQHELDTLALVSEGRRKVERRPSIVLAFLDFARRTTAALIFGNESR